MQGEDYVSMIPAAYFKNIGSDPAQDFFCHSDIIGLSYYAENYADSVEITTPLPAGDSILVEFNEWVAGDEESMPYEASFYATGVNSQWTVVPFNSTVGVAEKDAFLLEIAGRNPFSQGTLIAYDLPRAMETSVKVYDASGALVRTLHQGILEGSGSLSWDGADDEGRNLSGGLYFIRMATPEHTQTAKLIMVK